MSAVIAIAVLEKQMQAHAEVQEELESLRRKESELRFQTGAARDAAGAAIADEWLAAKVDGMDDAERQDTLAHIGMLFSRDCDAKDFAELEDWGKAEAERKRLALEAFGEHLHLFYPENETNGCSNSEARAHRAVARGRGHIPAALKRMGCELVISNWRAEPASGTDNVLLTHRRERWLADVRKMRCGWATPAMLARLRQLGRVKANGKNWSQISGCAWSFKSGLDAAREWRAASASLAPLKLAA